mgnify:CR=1 FL=1
MTIERDVAYVKLVNHMYTRIRVFADEVPGNLNTHAQHHPERCWACTYSPETMLFVLDVVPIKHHHFIPGCYEIVDKARLGIICSIHFRNIS